MLAWQLETAKLWSWDFLLDVCGVMWCLSTVVSPKTSPIPCENSTEVSSQINYLASIGRHYFLLEVGRGARILLYQLWAGLQGLLVVG